MANCSKIVSNEQDRDLPFLADLRNELQHSGRCLTVHARRGFVKHQDVRTCSQGASDEHALFLTTGEFGKPLVGKLIRARRTQTFAREARSAGGTRRPGIRVHTRP